MKLGILLLTLVASANSAFALATAFYPAANATGVLPDTPLRLTFQGPPTLGTGSIQIHDAADDSLVESIDVSKPVGMQAIGGRPDYNYYPIIISGREAAIYPKHGTLAYGHTYYVTIDPDAFKVESDPVPVFFSQPKTGWRFATRNSAPPPGTRKLTVAADGSGDFCTVQGAIDSIPAGNTVPITITLKRGTYIEIVCLMEKHNITIAGEDRKTCIIEYANNERFNGNSGGNPFAAGAPSPGAVPATGGGAIYRRGMFLVHRSNDFVLANLTLHNTTAQGGGQAEAIIINGTTTGRAIVKDVDLYSFQDTLQINGQAFVSNCYIEGDVDFMWGTGPCFFANCTAHSLRSGAYFTQIRNPPTNHGYVFEHCIFEGGAGVTGNYLSRIQLARFPASEVVLIDCTLGPAVGAVGWQFQATAGATDDPSRVHFWEFNSRTPDGKPFDVSQRLAGSRQLTEPADATSIANYRNRAFVLGNNWNP